MLDFDFICKRETPSIAAVITPGSTRGKHKVFFGTNEKLLPIFGCMDSYFSFVL